jgi:hypothetical protein
MTAFPMLARCAARQLNPDADLNRVLAARADETAILRPNLFLDNGPRHFCDEHCPEDCCNGGWLRVPMLMLKEG